MKIKIKKSSKLIRERYGFSPTTTLPTAEMFKNLGLTREQLKLLQKDKENVESLFNKDLLFYDLETTGLRKKEGKNKEIPDMIHQIAILKYSPNGDPDSINAERPDDFYVAKASIPDKYSNRSTQLKIDRAHMLSQTEEGHYTQYKKLIDEESKSFEKEPTPLGNNPTDEHIEKCRDDVKETIGLFLHIVLNYAVKNKAKKDLLGYKEKRKQENSVYLRPLVVEYIKTLEQKDKLLEILDNGNPSREDLINFYSLVFSEGSIQGGVSTYFSDKGFTLAKNRVQSLINMISSTTEENKIFTMYDNFPLKKYHISNSLNQQYTAPVSEEEALKGMMEFIDKQGNPSKDDQIRGDYVLVGQNIISFDNPFVIARCKNYGITNTQNFENSFVYDTRYLFSTMIRYFTALAYFYGLVETAHIHMKKLENKKQENPNQSEMYDKAIKEFHDIKLLRNYKKIGIPTKEVRTILNNLIMSGKPKGKLETLMKAFIEDAPKQTHTADDDCEKLAAVFIPAMKKFHEIYEQTYEFVNTVDEKNIVQIFRIVKGSPIDKDTKTKKKTIQTQIGTTKAAIGFDKAKGIGDIIKKVAKKFIEDLSLRYLDNPPKDLAGKDKKELEEIIINYFKVRGLTGHKSTEIKMDTFKEYMDYTELQTIEWIEKNLIPSLSQPPTTVKENKKRIKLRILKENKNGKTTRNQRS